MAAGQFTQLATEVLRSTDSGIAPAHANRLVFSHLASEVLRSASPNLQSAQLAGEVLRSDDSGIRTGGAERLVFGQVAIEVLSQYLAPPHALSAQLAAEVLRSPMPNLQSAQLAGEVLRSDDSGMRQFASRIVLSQLAIEVLHVIEPIHACNCEIIPKNAPALRMLHRSYVDRVMHRLAKFNKGTR